MEVDSVVRKDSYNVQLIGRLISSSNLYPEFQKGMRVEVPSYNVESWKQVDKEGEVVDQGPWLEN